MQIKSLSLDLHDFMEYIYRHITPHIEECGIYFQVIVVTGPRQVGKTTLCKHLFADYKQYNLEDAALRMVVASDPKKFLMSCGTRVVIDEVQHVPELLSYIQLMVDQNSELRFVLTGSSDFALLESITQSLAGRAAVFTLLPLSLKELGDYACTATDSLMLGGFYPAVRAKGMPYELFYRNYFTTYVERDVRQIKEIVNLREFQKFIKLLAGRVGSECNASALSNEIGVSAPTIKKWFGLLQTSYIAFALQPYYVNIGKRLTKTPKVYFYDTGLLCFLLNIENTEQLAVHPLRGAIFENLVIAEMMKDRFNQAKRSNLTFYRENSGREVDVVQENGNLLSIFEIKSASTYNREFSRQLDYLKKLMGDKIASAKVIYDGDTIPPDILNFRQLLA